MSSWRTIKGARVRARWLAFGLSLAAIGAAPGVAQASAGIHPVYTVTNTSDDSSTTGSLPWAIDQSNSNGPGPNEIDFNLSGSGFVSILPTSALPTITVPVVIDGSSQPGFSGSPLVVLNGSDAPSGTSGLTITAGSSTVKDIMLINWSGTGIALSTKGRNTLTGDYVGYGGSSALANGNGISASSQGNTIGGTAAGAGDVISGNTHFGLILSGAGAKNNVVDGNYIGTDPSGSSAVPNGLAGIFVASKASGNTIGGAAAGSRNVISGNHEDGVDVMGAGTASNKVEGNFVGTDATGASALGNGNEGIAVYEGAAGNTVGGTTAAARNVVSGNAHDGVAVNGKGTSGNHVEGNYIGLNATGTAALGNGGIGAPVYGGATGNTVGGTTPGARNVISGNANYGVTLVNTGTSHNLIEGNYIGTNPAGTAAMGNRNGGVDLYLGSTDNTVGGTKSATRNVISGNGSSGVGIHGKGTSGNVVEGNFIGTNPAGIGPLGNAQDGVVINMGAVGNLIGGTVAGSGNRIAYNHSDGVQVGGAATHGDRIERNLIYSDVTKVGIALTSAANGGQPAPVIEKVTQSSLATKLTVKVSGSAHYRVEVFANPSCFDPEGKQYVGATAVKGGTYSLTLSAKLPAGEGVTATATNQSTSNTSRFSGCKRVP